MKKSIIALLLLCCLASPAWADSVQLQENHPDRYVVVKGDTLWDISARFLKDPWRWPQVWKMNREQIKNPHLIYPGDVVVLDLSGGDPQLRLLRETVKLEPGARVEQLEKAAIPSIPPSVIAPFLKKPLVVENDSMNNAPIIVAADEERILIDIGAKVYADKISEQKHWQIYRPGNPLIDPDTGKSLGIEAIHLGDSSVVRYGSPATLEVTRANQDIAVGDRLVQAPPATLQNIVPHAPENNIKGRIILSDGPVEKARGMVVAINRGAADGLEVGHVLAIYQEGATLPPVEYRNDAEREGYFSLERHEDGTPVRTEDGLVITDVGTRPVNGEPDRIQPALKLPDERRGLMMVFRTFNHVSYALIVQSTHPVHIGDIVTNPR
jgi:LysM domain